jgi:hypothetical protein
MSLPLSRNTTYGTESPFRSFDLNDVQDKIIALHSRGSRIYTVSVPLKGIDLAGASSYSNSITATLLRAWIPLSLEIGATIVAYRLWVRDSALNFLKADLYRELNTASGAGASVIAGTTTNVSSGSGASQLLQKTPLAVLTASTYNYLILVDYQVGSAGGNFQIDGLEVDYQVIP